MVVRQKNEGGIQERQCPGAGQKNAVEQSKVRVCFDARALQV